MAQIRLSIERVYRGVPYSITADLNEIETMGDVVKAFLEAERFIDRMLDRVNGLEVRDMRSNPEKAERQEE